jgi:hypothetical protein
MKYLLSLLGVLFLFAAVTPETQARRRWFRQRSTSYAYTYVNVWGVAANDQERCVAEANYMAANYAYYHVGANIGNFEGWGVGSTPSCGTCVPGYGMTLTGDAACQASNGQWFRVRSWR